MPLNETMPTADMKQRIGNAAIVACISVVWLFAGYWAFQRLKHYPPQQLWNWTLDHAVLLAVGGLIGFLVISTRKFQKRPFFHVPWEARWWEFFVFGATTGLISLIGWLVTLCVIVVLPILVPLEFMRAYVLGPNATLVSALVALPAIFLTISVVFAGIYLAMIVNRKGNLVRSKDKTDLYTGKLGESWQVLEIYYFSLSTMVKASPQYEATGWCRWAALFEVIVSRVLEVVIVTVGIGVIVKRSMLPHP